MINFSPTFVADKGKADLQAVADHVEHVAAVAGKKQYVNVNPSVSPRAADILNALCSVGIGSDFDGIDSVPVGLEDVSKYPDLVSCLIIIF